MSDASEADLYVALDWLLERQGDIEKRLARRHLGPGGVVLYDLSSSDFEDTTCPLAGLGYSRNGKKGTLQVYYGVLTDSRGCPIAVSVYEGNSADPRTLLPEIEPLKRDFAIHEFVLVGDRRMISQKPIGDFRGRPGVDWITALKSTSIRALVSEGHVQLDLFDERNLFELSHPDFPGERLVACRNPALAQLRAHKRESPLEATEGLLEKVRRSVLKGRAQGPRQERRAGRQGDQPPQGCPSTSNSTSTTMPSALRAVATVSSWKRSSTGSTSSAPRCPSRRWMPRSACVRTSRSHSFTTLLAKLSVIVRNVRFATPPDQPASTFEAATRANRKQQQALDLPQTIVV